MKLAERVELIQKSLAQCEEEALAIIADTQIDGADPEALSRRTNVVAARLFRLNDETKRLFEEYGIDNSGEPGV